MPSEDRVRDVVAAFARAIAAFDSSLARTADEVRAFMAPRQSGWEAQVARAKAQLGPLAADRIDPERFATVFAPRRQTEPAALKAADRALETLVALAARREALCTAEVPPGGSLYDTVARTLGEVGRAFAAARLVHDVRAGGAAAVRSGAIAALPYSEWTRNERRVAPPVVVSVGGGDLRAAALVEFLDGRQKLVLVVEGECSPAPLARLIGAATFVAQVGDAPALARLVAWDGPGIAAIVPESAARFVHDPGAAERLTIESIPDRTPRKSIAGLSPAQQADELQLLRTLAARRAVAAGAAAAAAAGGAGNGGEPADKLAAWLLSQVNLADIG